MLKTTTTIVFAVLILSGFIAFPDSLHADTESPPVNIVLIMIDDMGWMDLHCQGNDKLDTPRIDAFATQGMRFTNAYAASPVCSPTRAALISGLAPARLGITQHGPNNPRFAPKDAPLIEAETSGALPLQRITIAERLKVKGYATAFIGKWHLSNTTTREKKGKDDRNLWPTSQGFDINIGGCDFGGPPTFWDPYRIPSIEPRKKGEYLTDRLADESITFLRENKDKPFFLCLWPYNVHYPFEAPEQLVKKYEPRLGGKGLKNATYGGQVEATDIAIGRVLDELDNLKLADSTLVIFTSDNGGWMGATDNRPLRAGKGMLYEGGIRVPLIIRAPGITRPGSESNTPVIIMDLTATIFDLTETKLAPGEQLDGESLRPLLSRSGRLNRDAIYFHYPHYAFHGDNRPGGAIREGDYKLIQRFDDQSIELYNVVEDIGEKNNLADKKPELADRLLRKLKAWQTQTGAKMPTKVE